MHINPKQDLLFESVKQMVIETRTPSISLAQRTFRINYSRAASMLAAMEGDIVTAMDERGMRRMLIGETNDYCSKENTVQKLLPEIMISLAMADADFMAALSSTVGDISMALQVSKNDVIKSTGMVSIPSGVITANDVGRVIEAAMSCSRSIIQASSICHYRVDDSLETELMPIGMPCQKLQVSIALLPIPENRLQRWHDWAKALGRNLVGWRVEVLTAHE